MIEQQIGKLSGKKSLENREMEDAISKIMEGVVEDGEIKEFLLKLEEKGLTPQEIASGVRVLRKFMAKVTPKTRPLVDTCGTGGDKKGFFNISTAAAFIAAGAGCRVAKHGNRAASSHCGSADVLEALGVNLGVAPGKVAGILDKIGMAFMFAPSHHPSMKNVAAARKELGIRTIFNILGPLTNPADAEFRLVGVADESLMGLMASALKELKVKRALLVHGEDGTDEITTAAKTKIIELKDNELREYEISPEEVGIAPAKEQDLLGGSAEENAKIIREVLSGKKGPALEISVLNAAAAIYVCGKAASLGEGVALARKSIGDGAALKKLDELVKATNDEHS